MATERFMNIEIPFNRERKNAHELFLHKLFEHRQGSGTSQLPPFETQGRQTFEGGHELFGHHPFARKTPAPPGGLRTQKS